MAHLMTDERSNTNSVLDGMLSVASTDRQVIEKRLEEVREKNLVREFEKFKASGKSLPKNFIERVPGAGKRFSTTTEAALQNTARRMGEMQPRKDIIKQAKDRKMANWTTQHSFGNDDVDYQTGEALKTSYAKTKQPRIERLKDFFSLALK